MTPRWERGDELIHEGLTWLAKQFDKTGARPFTVDVEWARLEDAWEAPYLAHDEVGLKAALREFLAHAVSKFKEATPPVPVGAAGRGTSA